MTIKSLALALALGSIAAGPALAQNDATPATPQAPAAAAPATPAPVTPAPAATDKGGASFLTQAQVGEYRASQLVGVNIYNASNESIGEVNELLVDKKGSIQAVVIGVGGFLGLGQKNVALPYTAITWEDKPLENASVGMAQPNAPGAATTPATGTGAMTAATPAPAATTVHDYPDHGLLNMTKEQLQAAPDFKFASEAAK